MSAPVLVVVGDLGDPRCGVGSSEAAILPLAAGEVRTIDPTAGTFLAHRRALIGAARGAAGALLAYPTNSQLERVRLVPRFLYLRWLLRGRWIRVHLHEFDRLRRRHRIAVALLVGALADRVVVSSAREADALRRHYRGWGARAQVVVAPPANGSAPAGSTCAPSVRPGVVGVVGQHRPDKGLTWLLRTLERLDPRFDRLEIVGRGWDDSEWPRELAGRLTTTVHGEIPEAEMADRIGAWELALAPYDEPPHDGRLSLRTPLAYGVPTLTRGPRPPHLQLSVPHLLFDDEVDVGALRLPPPADRASLAATVATEERDIRARLVRELLDP